MRQTKQSKINLTYHSLFDLRVFIDQNDRELENKCLNQPPCAPTTALKR